MEIGACSCAGVRRRLGQLAPSTGLRQAACPRVQIHTSMVTNERTLCAHQDGRTPGCAAISVQVRMRTPLRRVSPSRGFCDGHRAYTLEMPRGPRSKRSGASRCQALASGPGEFVKPSTGAPNSPNTAHTPWLSDPFAATSLGPGTCPAATRVRHDRVCRALQMSWCSGFDGKGTRVRAPAGSHQTRSVNHAGQDQTPS